MENNVLKISKKADRLTVTFVHRSLKKTIKSTVAHSDQTNELCASHLLPRLQAEKMPEGILKAFKKTKIDFKESGALYIQNLPHTGYDYVFETDDTLIFRNIKTQAAHLKIQAKAFYNQQSVLEVGPGGFFTFKVGEFFNQSGRVVIQSPIETFECRGTWHHTSKASFVALSSFKASIGRLQLNNSQMILGSQAELICETLFSCKNESLVCGSSVLVVKSTRYIVDETSVVTSKSDLTVQAAVLQTFGPVVGEKLNLSGEKRCHLYGHSYGRERLSIYAPGQWSSCFYNAGESVVLDRGYETEILKPRQAFEGNVHLKGGVVGYEGDFRCLGVAKFTGRKQGLGSPYSILLAGNAYVNAIQYFGEGVWHKRGVSFVESDAFFDVCAVDLQGGQHICGGSFGNDFSLEKPGRPFQLFYAKTQSFLAKKQVALAFASPPDFLPEQSAWGGLSYRISSPLSQNFSIQTNQRSGYYGFYLTTQTNVPTLRSLNALHRNHIPLLIQQGQSIFVYGLTAQQKPQITQLVAPGQPLADWEKKLYEDMPFPELASGFKIASKRQKQKVILFYNPKIQLALFQKMQSLKAHVPLPGDLKIVCELGSISIGSNLDKPIELSAYTGAVSIQTQDFRPNYIGIYGKTGIGLKAFYDLEYGQVIEKSDPKPPSYLTSEGNIHLASENGEVLLCSTVITTVGKESDLRIESQIGTKWIATRAQIGGSAYLPDRVALGMLDDYQVPGPTIGTPNRGNAHECRRQPVYNHVALTSRSYLIVSYKVFCNRSIHLYGALLFAGEKLVKTAEDSDSAPEIIATTIEHAYAYVDQALGGHKKRRKAFWENFPMQKQVLDTYIGQVLQEAPLALHQAYFGSNGALWSSETITLQVDSFGYGEEGNLQVGLSVLHPHSKKWDLTRFLETREAQTYSNPYAPYYETSAFPICFPDLPEIPVIVQAADGSLSENTAGLRKRYAPDKECEAIFLSMIQELGGPYAKGCYTKEGTYETIAKTTQAWFKRLFPKTEQKQGKELVEVLENTIFKSPVLVFEKVKLSGEWVLEPKVLNPIKPKHVALLYNHLHANVLKIACQTGVLTGNLYAIKSCDLTAERFHIQRRQAQTEQEVVEHESSRFGPFRNTAHTSRKVILQTAQVGSGNLVVAEGRLKANIGTLSTQGVTVQAQQIEAQLGDWQDNPNLDSHISRHTNKDGNALQSKRVNQVLEHGTIQPSVFEADKIAITVKQDATLNATTVKAAKKLQVHCGGLLRWEDALYAEKTGTQIESRKLMLSETYGIVQKNHPAQFISTEGEIDVASDKAISGMSACFLSYEKTRVVAPTLRLETRQLKHCFQTKRSGISGMKVVSQSSTTIGQTAVQTTAISVLGDIELIATEGDLTLFSPFFEAASGQLVLRAKKNLALLETQLDTTIDTHSHSAGLEFFGCDALEALIKADFQKAAKALLQNLPLLGELKALLKSKDTADISVNALKTLYNTYHFMDKMGKSGSLWKDLGTGVVEHLKDKLSEVGVRFAHTKSFEASSTALIPWLIARRILIESETGDVHLNGVSAKASESIGVSAKKVASLNAVSDTQSATSRETGFKIGANRQGPSVGVDLAKAESYAKQYTACVLKAPKISLISGEKLNLAGVCLEAQEAFLESQVIEARSLQDSGRNKQFGGHVSVGVNSFSAGLHGGQGNTLQTEGGHTRIYAHKNLHIRAHQSTHLQGAEIGVGNEGTGKFISPIITFEDLEDIEKSSSYHASVGVSAKRISGIGLGGKRQDKRDRVRATVHGAVNIQTESDISGLNRDEACMRENTKHSKRHIEVYYEPGVSLGNLKDEFGRIPQYFQSGPSSSTSSSRNPHNRASDLRGNKPLENQTELAQNNENHSKGNAVSGQAVNSSSTRLRRLQSEGIDSPEQQTPQASASHEPMPVIASQAEPGPRSSLCSNFTTKLLSLLMLSGTAEASSGSPKKEEEEAHTLGELIRDYHHEGESWVGTTGRFLRESGIREGLDNTFETLGACAEVVTKALFGMPERGLRHVARELGFEVRTGAPRTEHSIERVKEFIGHKIRQDAEAIKPALKNVVEKYAITADELLAVRTTLEVVPIAKAGQLAQKGAGNLVRKGLTKLDQRLVQTTAQPMLFSADGVAVRNLEAGLGTVSREGKSLSRTKTKGQAAAGKHALSQKGISHPELLTKHELGMIEQEWVSMRRKFLGDFEKQDFLNVPQNTREALNRARNAVRDSMKPDDLAAVMKESRGVKIRKPDGTLYQHAKKEWPQSRDSLGKTIYKLQDELRIAREMGQMKNGEILQKNLSSLSKLLDKYQALIRRSECLAKEKFKLEP